MLNRKRTKREVAYDKNISGLMTQIIKVCKENDIAAHFYFDLSGPEDSSLACTTAILQHDEKAPVNKLIDAMRILGMKGGTFLSDHVKMRGEIGKAIFNPEYTSRDEVRDILKRPSPG